MCAFPAVRRALWSGSALALAIGSAAAQSQWFVHGSDADVCVVGATTETWRGPRIGQKDLPAGDYTVHFGVDAAGKPNSLQFPVPDGARVRVAIEPAPAASAQVQPLAEGWQELVGGDSAAPWQARYRGELDARDYRVAVVVAGKADSAAFGVLARWLDGKQHYRFVWDRRHDELRLERQLGTDVLVLGKAKAPPADDRPHELALQAAGFRVQAFCDQALVLQAFDGAMTRGGFGTWSLGSPPDWQRIALEPVAALRASAALVQTGSQASFHAITEAGAGHYALLELRLDRPFALVPLSSHGLEPWLMQPPAVPRILMADWRNSLGADSLSEVASGGVVVGTLQWPLLPALQRQAALVRALIVSPDGEVVVTTTPSAALVF